MGNEIYIQTWSDLIEMFQIEIEPETVFPESSTEPLKIPRYRMPESELDFQIVFDKQFKKQKATDSEIFRRFHLERMDEKHSILKNESHSTNYKDYELLEKYIQFLSIEQKRTTIKHQKSFVDYLKYQDDGLLMSRITELMKEKKCKRAAAIIRALVELKFIEIEERGLASFYKSMRAEFGNFGTDSGINYFMSDQNTKLEFRDEIEKIKDSLIK